MTRIVRSPDCGNSPKNLLAQEIAVALECGETPDALSDACAWQTRGGALLAGKAAIAEALSDQARPAALTIHHALSHGKVGAASGETTLEDGRVRRFCHVVEFSTAAGRRVKAISSFAGMSEETSRPTK
ncbi:hypothetical protein HNE_0023 [Hyphomonas neptunium ATCC 15444]|uniref:SnoaL-like domain-containing protein n=2 Tax=Hyphomonas TaxID=85 RepID=Q0C686_HYPNA|nr:MULTISPECIES: hypothetical protein [Hyphomonas]ABI76226.1 hypothetical protein HNE_0023 [Hyphomonas neptunium ATCC 15444]KCZ94837.1 hypothetical protein HHI_08583 [Hyphomonas hirschiana VP5]